MRVDIIASRIWPQLVLIVIGGAGARFSSIGGPPKGGSSRSKIRLGDVLARTVLLGIVGAVRAASRGPVGGRSDSVASSSEIELSQIRYAYLLRVSVVSGGCRRD